jgi:hypothetical protein
MMPSPGARHMTAGALVLALPGAVVALSGAANALGATPGPSLRASVSRHSIRYGSSVTVRGTAPSGDAGRAVQLQFQGAGSGSWRTLARSTVSSSNHFSFHVRLRQTGRLRAVSPAAQPSASNPTALAASSSTPAPSVPQRVGVAARLSVSRHTPVAETGHRISLRGRLLADRGGRTVRLVTHTHRGWRTLARARTGRHGGFDLHYVVRGTGTRWLRVSFLGDRDNGRTSARDGRVTGLVPRVASWYNDGGNTACGFHAYYGVANRTLPCGTKVTFAYHGRSVVATVDDRGPYVGGRDYDFNQNIAHALGMYGVAGVLASR